MAGKIELTPGKTFGKLHPGHEGHFCALAARKQIRKIAKAAEHPQFICNICCRVASDAKHLCEPKDIKGILSESS